MPKITKEKLSFLRFWFGKPGSDFYNRLINPDIIEISKRHEVIEGPNYNPTAPWKALLKTAQIQLPATIVISSIEKIFGQCKVMDQDDFVRALVKDIKNYPNFNIWGKAIQQLAGNEGCLSLCGYVACAVALKEAIKKSGIIHIDTKTRKVTLEQPQNPISDGMGIIDFV